MARDPRWHTGWILSFLAMQFIFALIVLALNSSYWAQYGGVVHSQLIQSGFASEPPFEQNVEQVTKPLNTYIFAISSTTLVLALLETLFYFVQSLHPLFVILTNIVLFLAWAGCLAVYFLWGGGLVYTGAAWLSRYNSFCNLKDPTVASGVEYIYTVTCGGEKILIIMLPFICLNILLLPLSTLNALFTLLRSHRSKERRQPFPLHPQEPTPPYHLYHPHQQPQPQQQHPQQQQQQPQPLIHQGVLYHPVGVAPSQSYRPPPPSLPHMTELSGHPAPLGELGASNPPAAGNLMLGSGEAELGTDSKPEKETAWVGLEAERGIKGESRRIGGE